jgi:hypothetical protein
MLKDWTKTQKQEARRQTLVTQLKPDQQYWTMAGLCERQGCELTQVLEAGVRPDQFHGVDLSYEVIRRNRAAFPEINWHHGDLYWAMAAFRGFNPGVVNADMVQAAEGGSGYVSKLMTLLTPFPCVLIANFVLKHRGYKLKDGDYVLCHLAKHQGFRAAIRSGWKYDGKFYQYRGAGGSDTVMGTFIFDNR